MAFVINVARSIMQRTRDPMIRYAVHSRKFPRERDRESSIPRPCSAFLCARASVFSRPEEITRRSSAARLETWIQKVGRFSNARAKCMNFHETREREACYLIIYLRITSVPSCNVLTMRYQSETGPETVSGVRDSSIRGAIGRY